MSALPNDARARALWRYGSDLAERNLLFVPEVFYHPAKMHLGLLRTILEAYTDVGDTILDPMAGSGSLLLGAYLHRNVILRDLQPEYVAMMYASESIVRSRAGLFCGSIDIAYGDARKGQWPGFDHVVFSPPYGFETGNSMSAQRRADMIAGKYGRKWQRKMNTLSASWMIGYRYEGGSNNAGNKTGRNYWGDMRLIYGHIAEQLPAGGLMITVIKNHYRRGVLRDVVGQTVVEAESLGLRLIDWRCRALDRLSLWQRRRKEQGMPVVEVEDVLVFEKGRP